MLSLSCVWTAAPARLLRRGVPLQGASSDIRHYPATSGAFQSWLWVEEILCDFPAVAGDLTAGCVLSLQQRHGFTQEEATKQNLEFSAHLWMRRCCFVLHAVCLCCLHAGQCGWHFVAVEVQCLLLTQDHKEKDKLRSHNATHVLTIPFLSTLHTLRLYLSLPLFLLQPVASLDPCSGSQRLCSSCGAALWQIVHTCQECLTSTTQHQKGEELTKFKEVGGPLNE